jgi:hypothetical protein
MAQKHRFNQRRQRSGPVRRRQAVATPPLAVPVERKPPVVFGKPFVVLEDEDKNTFEYARGAWVPYAMSIAQCRQECQVKELPQKVNGKTRYEVRCPVPAAL